MLSHYDTVPESYLKIEINVLSGKILFVLLQHSRRLITHRHQETVHFDTIKSVNMLCTIFFMFYPCYMGSMGMIHPNPAATVVGNTSS